MPTSGYQKIGRVMGVLSHMQPLPKTVLDVGIGFGKYGFLMREHLDVRPGRYRKEEWETRIDGVEIWEQYITPLHSYVYDKVYIGDIRELITSSLGGYDLIILSDVIEHMPMIEGASLLQALFSKVCNKAMVVSYPTVIGNNWKEWENPYEEHHCVWTVDHFKMFFPNMVANGSQVVYILK